VRVVAANFIWPKGQMKAACEPEVLRLIFRTHSKEEYSHNDWAGNWRLFSILAFFNGYTSSGVWLFYFRILFSRLFYRLFFLVMYPNFRGILNKQLKARLRLEIWLTKARSYDIG